MVYKEAVNFRKVFHFEWGSFYQEVCNKEKWSLQKKGKTYMFIEKNIDQKTCFYLCLHLRLLNWIEKKNVF